MMPSYKYFETIIQEKNSFFFRSLLNFFSKGWSFKTVLLYIKKVYDPKITNFLFKFLLCIILVLTLVEISLRLYVFLYVQNIANLYTKGQHQSYRRYKILAVGESTTVGLWIEKESYPLQLQKMINSYLNCDCVSVNVYTSPGANTAGLLKNYPSKLLEYRPDIVLFMTGENDNHYFTYNLEALFLEKYFYNKSRLLSSLSENFIMILNEIRLFRIVKLLYSNFILPQSIYLDRTERFQFSETGSTKRQFFSEQHESFLKISTQKNIKRMIDITKLNGVTPILLTYHMSSINNFIRKTATENDILLIDNEIIFKKVTFKDYVLPRDNWHPNKEGYSLIAKNVMRYLLDNKLIDYIEGQQ